MISLHWELERNLKAELYAKIVLVGNIRSSEVQLDSPINRIGAHNLELWSQFSWFGFFLLLAVWLWAFHFASLCLGFLFRKVGIKKSIYFSMVLFGLNGLINEKCLECNLVQRKPYKYLILSLACKPEQQGACTELAGDSSWVSLASQWTVKLWQFLCGMERRRYWTYSFLFVICGVLSIFCFVYFSTLGNKNGGLGKLVELISGVRGPSEPSRSWCQPPLFCT